MTIQRRWFCNGCNREWVAVVADWDSSIGCPMPDCSSGKIELVEYIPSFIGSDIPRKPAYQEIQQVFQAPVVSRMPMILEQKLTLKQKLIRWAHETFA